MVDDLRMLMREFDLATLFRPQSAEQLLINLVIIAIMAACVTVAWKALARLF